jgi:Tfp pilus tip-associated adhesin PilY1
LPAAYVIDPNNDLTNQTTTITSIDLFADATVTYGGWYIDLDPAGDYSYTEVDKLGNPSAVTRPYGAERVITNPLASVDNVVFFTSYKPYSEECEIGGKSFLWAVEAMAADATTNLKGSALMQVSTGAIEKIEFSEIMGSGDSLGRRSTDLEGVPPTAQGFSLFLSPDPVKRIIHSRER